MPGASPVPKTPDNVEAETGTEDVTEASTQDIEMPTNSGEEEVDDLKIPSLPNPITPLQDSYTWHSPLPTAPGPYILGVDEAGRGPVLGPLVYGIAYCAESWETELEGMGFADSKTLTAQRRSTLLSSLCDHPEQLGWSVNVLSPQSISYNMLKHPPTNLNVQSQNATIQLIQHVLSAGLSVSKIFVDALGPSPQYQSYLSNLFPGIDITVQPKADSKWKIVGAASVAAKVTRDGWIENWAFTEAAKDGRPPIGTSFGSQTENPEADADGWDRKMGSGYPSDPNTKAWLKRNIERTFGFPSVVRFSWGTVKNILDEKEYDVQWTDETQTGLVKNFQSASGLDKGRCAVSRQLGLRSVADI